MWTTSHEWQDRDYISSRSVFLWIKILAWSVFTPRKGLMCFDFRARKLSIPIYDRKRERGTYMYSNLCIVNRHQTPFYKMHWYVNRNRTLLISNTNPLEDNSVPCNGVISFRDCRRIEPELILCHWHEDENILLVTMLLFFFNFKSDLISRIMPACGHLSLSYFKFVVDNFI